MLKIVVSLRSTFFIWFAKPRLVPHGGIFDARGQRHLALPGIRDTSGTGYFLKAISIGLVAGGPIFRVCGTHS